MVKVIRSSKDDGTNATAQKRTIVKEEPLDDASGLIALTTKPKSKPKSRVTVKSEPGIKSEDRSNAAGSEDEDSENEKNVKKKRRERPTNDNSLPPALSTNKKLWRSTVLPTLLNYVGSFHNPWTISEDKTIAYLQPILDHFLPRTDRYMIQPSDPMLGLVRNLYLTNCRICDIAFQVTQRLNEWRSTFGSTAIAVLDTFFGLSGQDTLAERQDFANYMLKNKTFLYSEPNKKQANGEVCCRSSDLLVIDLNYSRYSPWAFSGVRSSCRRSPPISRLSQTPTRTLRDSSTLGER